ncbi:MAG TPA: hypothetical protein VF109_03410 [Mycobacteriales bacterium]
MGLWSPALGLGIAQVAAAALVPVAIVWLALNAGRVAGAVVRVLRRCHLLPRPKVVVKPGPPLERIAADLRRLSGARRLLPRGTSRARQQGLLRAYDEVLGLACAALDVPHALAEMPPGMDRDLERLRVEEALRGCGLALDPPAPRHQDLP